MIERFLPGPCETRDAANYSDGSLVSLSTELTGSSTGSKYMSRIQFNHKDQQRPDLQFISIRARIIYQVQCPVKIQKPSETREIRRVSQPELVMAVNPSINRRPWLWVMARWTLS